MADHDAATRSASCVSCGERVGPSDRFCPHCGFSVQGGAAAGVDVLGVDGSTTVVASPKPGRGGGALSLLVIGALLVLVAASVLLDGGAPDAPAAAPAVTPATTQPPREATTTTRLRRRTSVPTTTSEPRVVDGAPFLGEPTGLAVLYSDGGALQAVELDTGVVRTIAVGQMSPLMVYGDHVVVFRYDARSGVYTVPYRAGNPPDAGGMLASGEMAARSVMHPDALWVGEWSQTGQRWRLVDLATAEVRETVVLPEGVVHPPVMGPLAAMGPEVVSSIDGGVFVLEGGAYRRVSTGAVMAAAPDRVLVRRCGEALECRPVWLDRTTWEVVDGPVVPDGPLVEVSPGARWLRAIQSEGTSVVIDRRSGATMGGDTGLLGWAPIAYSPDERFAVQVEGDRLAVTELETGERSTVPGVDSPEGVVVVGRPPPAG